MNISRNKIRDAAKRARLGESIYLNGERLTADEIGETGKYIYTYAGHPGFTSVAALVKFIQAADVADGPTTPPTKPESPLPGFSADATPDEVTEGSAIAEQNKDALANFVDNVNRSIGHASPDTVFGKKKAERRIRSHRRKLRRSGIAKGTPIVNTYA